MAKPSPILTAISCLSASPTPAAGAHRGTRHAGVRETCTWAEISQSLRHVRCAKTSGSFTIQRLCHWGSSTNIQIATSQQRANINPSDDFNAYAQGRFRCCNALTATLDFSMHVQAVLNG
jgi:hypothetical protein